MVLGVVQWCDVVRKIANDQERILNGTLEMEKNLFNQYIIEYTYAVENGAPNTDTATFITNLNLRHRTESQGNHCLSIHDVCLMGDRMSAKVLTTDNAVMLLSQESTTEQQTTETEIDTICGYHLGVLHGPYPTCPLCILRLCQ